MQTMYHLPTLRRRERIWQVAMPVLGLCLVAIMLSRIGSPPVQGWWTLWFPGILLIGQSISLLALYRERHKARKSVVARQFLICPHCRYRLDGLPEAGTCPECGRDYSPHTLRADWAKAYGIEYPLP